MNLQTLSQQVRDEIRRSGPEADVTVTLTNFLVRQGFDIRHEPSLRVVKHLLVEAVRAAEEFAVMSP